VVKVCHPEVGVFCPPKDLSNGLAVQRSFGAKERQQLRYMPPVHSSFNPLKAGSWLRITIQARPAREQLGILFKFVELESL
jgi:hypothetical protein